MKRRSLSVCSRSQSGFSLVEAAIVLVVIGIVLGAVLQGRSLIENAEYTSFEKQLRNYRAAFHQFRERYNGLPGDFATAAARFDSVNPPDGGNGLIDDGPSCDDAEDESCIAWQHLRAAGLLEGNPTLNGEDASPAHPYGGVIDGFFTGAQGNNRFEHKILITGLPRDVAIRLDREEDNELCPTGRVSLVPRSDCDGDDWPADETVVNVAYVL